MNNILTHKFGKSFTASMSFTGYIFLTVGLIFFIPSIIKGILGGIILGFCIALAGAFVALVKSGVQIDLENKTFRSYDHFLGIKYGKWSSYESYSFLTLLRSREESATLSNSNRRAVTSSDVFYDICLLNSKQQNKKVIKRLKKKSIAEKDILKLSQQLGFPVVNYQPPMSKKTKAKRKSRR